MAEFVEATDGRYTKKAVTIEAFHMTAERTGTDADWPDWLVAAYGDDVVTDRLDSGAFRGLAVVTLEGTMQLDVGAWIVRGVEGELYPCADRIFRATYNAADQVPEPLPGDPLARTVKAVVGDGVMLCPYNREAVQIGPVDRAGRPMWSTDEQVAYVVDMAARLER